MSESWPCDSPAEIASIVNWATTTPTKQVPLSTQGAGAAGAVVAESVPALDAVHIGENAQALSLAASQATARPLTGDDAFNLRFERSAHVAKLRKYHVGRIVEAGARPRNFQNG